MIPDSHIELIHVEHVNTLGQPNKKYILSVLLIIEKIILINYYDTLYNINNK